MSLTSIIIPTHSRPHLLPRAVESALASGSNIEVVVVDDASTDETASVCARLRGIKYVRVERNHDVAGARNVGLRSSHGEYVTFLDDDDVRLPNSIDEQISLLEADNEAALIYGQAIIGDQSCRPTSQIYPLECTQGDAFWRLLSQNFIPCGTAVFRRSCLHRIGVLDETIPGLDDWDLWLRIAEVSRIIALQQPVMIWRRSTSDSGQGTSDAARMILKAANQFRRSWRKLPRVATAPAHKRRAAWNQFSALFTEQLVANANESLRSGELTRAAKNAFVLVHLSPLVVMAFVLKGARSRLLRLMSRNKRETSESPSFDERHGLKRFLASIYGFNEDSFLQK
jgi:glycosyltransferase involved in cell wall biosynthesis